MLAQLKKINGAQFVGIMESLSDPIRINILELMMDGEICVCDIVNVTGLSQSKISYHIKILKDSGLISDRQEGRWVYYKLDLEVLSEIQNWIGNLIQSSKNRGIVNNQISKFFDFFESLFAHLVVDL